MRRVRPRRVKTKRREPPLELRHPQPRRIQSRVILARVAVELRGIVRVDLRQRPGPPVEVGARDRIQTGRSQPDLAQEAATVGASTSPDLVRTPSTVLQRSRPTLLELSRRERTSHHAPAVSGDRQEQMPGAPSCGSILLT